jgi:hypothetical protein
MIFDMTWRGQIRNGTIVLEQPATLPDGTKVEVEVRAVEERKTSPEKIEHLSQGIQYDFDAVDRQREKCITEI